MKKLLFISTLLAAGTISAFGAGTGISPLGTVDYEIGSTYSTVTTIDNARALITSSPDYWLSSTTISNNIQIGDGTSGASKGLLLTNGASANTYTFSGNITGDGLLAIYFFSPYIFTGDLSGFSGTMFFNRLAGVAATSSSVTFKDTSTTTDNVTTYTASTSAMAGTGSITSVNVPLVFTGLAARGEAYTIANSSITALNLTFEGGADYTVSGTVTGTGASSTLTVSAGNVTIEGASSTVSNFANYSVASGSTLTLEGRLSVSKGVSSTITGGGTIIAGAVRTNDGSGNGYANLTISGNTTVVVTSTSQSVATDTATVIGHWPSNATCVYTLEGGSTYTQENGLFLISWDGSAAANISGQLNAWGVSLNSSRNRNQAATLTLNDGGEMNIGEGGLTSRNDSTVKSFEFDGGEVGALADWTADATTVVNVNGNVTFNTTKKTIDSDTYKAVAGTEGATITLAGTTTVAEGATMNVTGAGTLKFTGTNTISGTLTVAEETGFSATNLTVSGENASATINVAGTSASSSVVTGTTSVTDGATLTVNYASTGGTGGIQGLGLGTINVGEGSTVAIYSANNRWGLALSSNTISGTLFLGAVSGSSAEYTLAADQSLSGATFEIGENATLQNYGTLTLTNVNISGDGTLKVRSDAASGSTGSVTITSTEGNMSQIYGNIEVASGTLYLAGTIDFNKAITVASGATVEFANGTVVDLDGYQATDNVDGSRTYTLFTGDGTVSVAADTTTSDPGTISFMFEGGALSSRKTVEIAADNKSVTISGSVATLVWNGGDTGTWANSDADSNKFWTNQNSADDYFVNNDNVTFNMANAVITVEDGVEAKNLTISDDVTLKFVNQARSTTTFAVNQSTTIADDKTLTLQSNLQNNGMSHQTVALNATGTGTIAVDHTSSDHNLALSVGDSFTGDLVWAGNLNPANLTEINGLNSLTLKTTTDMASGNSNTVSSIWSNSAVSLGVNTTIDGAYGFQTNTTFTGALTGTNADLSINSGVTVDAAGTVSGTFANTGAGTFKISGEIASGDTLTISAGTATFSGTNSGTLSIADGATVTATQAFAGTLSGDGVLDLGETRFASGTTPTMTDWTGTVSLSGGFTGQDLSDYANGTNSTVRLSGASGFFSTWAYNYNNTPAEATNIELVDNGSTYAFTNGAYSSESYTTKFSGKITGDGTFYGNISAASKHQSFAFEGDLSEFTGKFLGTASLTQNYNNTLTLGAGTETDTVSLGAFTIDWGQATAGGNGDNSVYFNYGAATAEFAGKFASGSIVKQGTGVLELLGDSSGFTGSVNVSAGTLKISNANAISTSELTVDAGAKLSINVENVAVTSVTLTQGAKLFLTNELLASALAGTISVIADGVDETYTLNVICSSAITVAGTTLTAGDVTNTLANYAELDTEFSKYALQTWAYDGNTLSLTLAIPEPSFFGLLAGTLALALAGTRRRRAKRA